MSGTAAPVTSGSSTWYRLGLELQVLGTQADGFKWFVNAPGDVWRAGMARTFFEAQRLAMRSADELARESASNSPPAIASAATLGES